jgi:hypothetical protein
MFCSQIGKLSAVTLPRLQQTTTMHMADRRRRPEFDREKLKDDDAARSSDYSRGEKNVLQRLR